MKTILIIYFTIATKDGPLYLSIAVSTEYNIGLSEISQLAWGTGIVKLYSLIVFAPIIWRKVHIHQWILFVNIDLPAPSTHSVAYKKTWSYLLLNL